MLIGIDENRKILWYNEYIGKSKSEQYISNGAVWNDAPIKIDYPVRQGKETEAYLNEDNTVRYEFKDIPPEATPEPTLTDLNEKVDMIGRIIIAGGVTNA